MDISRRSACDRCRGQKLRCVRPSMPGSGTHWGDEPLEPCERCLKAGADCINSHPPARKLMRAERFPAHSSPPLASSSERSTSHSLFPRNAGSYQHGVGMDPESVMGADGRTKESSSKKPESVLVPQPRTNFQGQFEDSPSKWRPKEPGSNHPAVNNADQGQLGGQNFRQRVRNRSRGSTSASNSLSTGRLDTPTFSTYKSPTSKPDRPFSVDSFDFGMGSSPEFHAHNDDTANLTHNFFISGQGTTAALPGSLATESTFSYSEKPRTRATDTKEDCLHRLTELSSRLLKDFRRTNSGKPSDISSFSTCCDSRVSDCLDGAPKSICTKHTIGRVLESSQTFLDILQHFHPDPPSSAESECSYSEYWDENEFAVITNDQSYPPNTMVPAPGNATHPSADNNEAQRTLLNPSVTVDMPTTLTMLTCYTCLLQTYDTVFSLICSWLSSRAETSSRSIPAMLPGLQIGGFDLDNHRDLQMEVLIQLSSKMLERIEETLGIGAISQPQDDRNDTPRGRGILDSASASALLDIMFKQGDLGHSRGANGTAALVKRTMDNIREILRSGS